MAISNLGLCGDLACGRVICYGCKVSTLTMEIDSTLLICRLHAIAGGAPPLNYPSINLRPDSIHYQNSDYDIAIMFF